MSIWTWWKGHLDTLDQWFRRLGTPPLARASVEERIASLRKFEENENDEARSAEDKNIRVKLQGNLKRFLEHGGPDCVILLLSSLCVTILERVLVQQKLMTAERELDIPRAVRQRYGQDGLFMYINLAGGLENERLPEPRRVPEEARISQEIQSYFHQIRNYSNRARHDPDFRLTISHARIALDAFLSILEWYYCSYKENRLATLYNARPDIKLLPSPPAAWVPLAFAGLVVLSCAAGAWAVAIGKLPFFPVLTMWVFGGLFLLNFRFAYHLFRQHAYTGSGQWGQWWGLWASLFTTAGLLGATFTSLFVGFPRDETRYIAVDLRVGRSEAPPTIELTPARYTAVFNVEHARQSELGNLDWARTDSMTAWREWMKQGISPQISSRQYDAIVYESQPFAGNHLSFTATFVFRGENRVRLGNGIALIKRINPATSEVQYQQIGFWFAEQAPEQGQNVSKNRIIVPALNAGDVLLLLVQLEALDQKRFPDHDFTKVYAAELQRHR